MNKNQKNYLQYLKNNIKILSEEQKKIKKLFFIENIDNKNILFKQILKNEVLWIDDDKIWSKISSNYGYDYMETKKIIQVWLNETTKWKRYKPFVG